MLQRTWCVVFSAKASKQVEKLPILVKKKLFALISDIEGFGPTLGLYNRKWPNFGLLRGKDLPKNAYHCHLKKGKPTFFGGIGITL